MICRVSEWTGFTVGLTFFQPHTTVFTNCFCAFTNCFCANIGERKMMAVLGVCALSIFRVSRWAWMLCGQMKELFWKWFEEALAMDKVLYDRSTIDMGTGCRRTPSQRDYTTLFQGLWVIFRYAPTFRTHIKTHFQIFVLLYLIGRSTIVLVYWFCKCCKCMHA